jgi:hypothetical protein
MPEYLKWLGIQGGVEEFYRSPESVLTRRNRRSGNWRTSHAPKCRAAANCCSGGLERTATICRRSVTRAFCKAPGDPRLHGDAGGLLWMPGGGEPLGASEAPAVSDR